ncbi:Sulfate/thiosulfate import ATP-binding protein CysA [Posidoniimonas polymericola]|uniref:Sulfate/thiosulfate import ATP-binding protein CysA n=1 Tax=Posidoniimonas polymericola TaxID=2528002 RepID=A0A5C5YKZ1_9BACT|nr:ATP-binding cassette domain-containing protein [Posidoniimonas polymericola]TWT75546.1 Sulfate/thiosulfate import ATP-binding protein CysA [Posidoniimonas polymericola]
MLRVENLTVTAGQPLLEGVTFSVGAGEYAVLMGPTGSGKTSLLETLCGLRPRGRGRIEIGGRDVSRAAVAERQIGYVSQAASLFPTMTVRENLSFPGMIRGVRAKQQREQADELAERLAVTHLLGRRAADLSGGEAQRVALGRALASKPILLLLDEPLSALDHAVHAEMVTLLKSVQQATGVTTLHVTHNRVEAQQVADRVFAIEGRCIGECAASPASGSEAAR